MAADRARTASRGGGLKRFAGLKLIRRRARIVENASSEPTSAATATKPHLICARRARYVAKGSTSKVARLRLPSLALTRTSGFQGTVSPVKWVNTRIGWTLKLGTVRYSHQRRSTANASLARSARSTCMRTLVRTITALLHAILCSASRAPTQVDASRMVPTYQMHAILLLRVVRMWAVRSARHAKRAPLEPFAPVAPLLLRIWEEGPDSVRSARRGNSSKLESKAITLIRATGALPAQRVSLLQMGTTAARTLTSSYQSALRATAAVWESLSMMIVIRSHK